MGTFKEIIIWIFIFIVGSLIVSFLIYPQSFDSFKYNVKSITGKVTSNLGTNLEKTIAQDNSIDSCLNEINRKLKIIETKSPINMNAYIEEYKKFDNPKGALAYLDEWGYSVDSLLGENGFGIESFFGMGAFYNNPPSDWLLTKQDNIIIALIKMEISGEGQTISQLSPVLCIDGELKTEKRCPKGIMTGITLTKNIPSNRMMMAQDWETFSYEVNSSMGNLYNYSLTLKDSSGEIVHSSYGDNPYGGKVEVDLYEIWDKEESEFETIFTFSTPCGTYTE